MTEDKRKDFEISIECIRDQKYDEAINNLYNLLSEETDEENRSYIDYLIGYIHTCLRYKDRNELIALQKLHSNINGNYPHPYAFILYSRLIQDKNVAENYLRKGIQLFPDDQQLFKELLRISSAKDEIVQQILECGVTEASLLGDVITYLFKTQQWCKISRFVFRLASGNDLSDFEKNYLELIRAYVLLFALKPNYEKAKNLFEKSIIKDTDNDFAYAHYLGIIYAYIQLGNFPKAIEYFDKLPVTNAIHDFDDRPWPLDININFEKQYKIIFERLNKLFAEDIARKNKAAALYALYLYSPSVLFDACRYSKADAAVLAKYLKNEFNPDVAAALYDMRCHYKQYKEAYKVLWSFLIENRSFDSKKVSVIEITNNASANVVLRIAEQTVIQLQNDDYDKAVFLKQIFPNLIEKLYENKQYKSIQSIAHFFSVKQILGTLCAFECAYSYGTTDDERSTEIYEQLILKEPDNSSAINNLGVQYEHKQEFFKALECYQKALSITPEDETQQRNLERIRNLIINKIADEILLISDLISLENLDEIGYTTELCQKILSIQDKDMQDVLLRDLRECAIAVIAGQDKSATIMCGSIIEALLMQKLKEQNVSKYDISVISKHKNASNYPIVDMGLNELLFVAEKTGVIAKNSYHLGHYIRDFRNVVHPAKEIRMRESINHDNVLTMWAVLKKMIEELL